MKAKEEGIGKGLYISFEDTSLSLYLNPFLLYHEFSFKNLKLFLELYATFVIFVGNIMEFMWLLFCGKKMNSSSKEILDELISILYCKEERGDLSPLKKMGHQNHALRFGEVKKMEYFKYIHLRIMMLLQSSTICLKRND
ncbi:hypothetical protein M9H77_30200 [Catharanthus roseus]|uniref:Uncharacterized protein n=1 Tax=Catharanthus roseus TaxID=4058 RepID=A0ACB9ZYU8_CATRO|nr:hypothetical protein M9H77_30200 [Catharanthus roseus]